MNDLPIGRIIGVFGVRGELKCDPTSAGRTLFLEGATLQCRLRGESRDMLLTGVREHKGRLLLRLAGVETAEDALALTGAVFQAQRDRLQLEPGEHFDADLVGCELFDSAGVSIGLVSAVEHYPASDMLIVDGKMIPMVREFIRTVDTARRRIEVELPEGLLD
jgi:16S rRNA processing protein RimM